MKFTPRKLRKLVLSGAVHPVECVRQALVQRAELQFPHDKVNFRQFPWPCREVYYDVVAYVCQLNLPRNSWKHYYRLLEQVETYVLGCPDPDRVPN